MSIPPEIAEIILPDSTLNVVDLSEFTIPPKTNPPDLPALPDTDLFSTQSNLVKSKDNIAFLQGLSMPSLIHIQQVQKRLTNYSSHLPTPNALQSLNYPITPTQNLRLPLWVLDYWRQVYQIVEHQKRWSEAIKWLRNMKSMGAVNMLTEVPWMYRMPIEFGDSVTDLIPLCSEKWLGVAQLDLMVAGLNDKAQKARIHALVQPNHFNQKLIACYRHERDTYLEARSTTFIRKLAEQLVEGSVMLLGMAVAVCITSEGIMLPNHENISNHWCGLIIDIHKHTLRYGDPLGHQPPVELIEIVRWWLHFSFPEPFSVETLSVTKQEDTYSCSILTINALAHGILPAVSLILQGNNSFHVARINELVNAVALLKKQDPKMLATHSNSTNMAAIEARAAFQAKLELGKESSKAAVKSKPEGKEKEKTREKKMYRWQASLDSILGFKQPTDLDDEDLGLSEDSETETTVVDMQDLIDIGTTSTTSALGGRPKKRILDDILQQCYRKPKREKILYRCLGGCGYVFSNRNTARAVRHAVGCHHLPADVRAKAKAYAASKAPSHALLDNNTSENGKDGAVKDLPGAVVVVKKIKLNENSSHATRKANVMEGLVAEARKAGKAKRHQMLDLAIVKLICCAGLPSRVLDLDEWKEAFMTADYTYVPATHAKLEEVQIIGEAEQIQALQIAYLKTQENITISCDGGTTTGRQAYWTLHMSTPGPDRKVYLMDVREATSESHTAVWIKTFVLEVSIRKNLIFRYVRISVKSVESVEAYFIITESVRISVE
ncbi:hypothetical protein BDZ97DRAFT_1923979 [Flammula alnicola]|nr:hypothetical protein BDZ97DRAFT_1923979 [Flammula alnicola]